MPCKLMIKFEMIKFEMRTGFRHFVILFLMPSCLCQRDILQDEIRVARNLIGGQESDLLAVRLENDKVRVYFLECQVYSCKLSNGWQDSMGLSFGFR